MPTLFPQCCFLMAILVNLHLANIATAQKPSPAQTRQKPAAQPTVPTAALKKLDLTYITPGAVGVVIVHPRRILTAPEAEWWPTELVTAAGLRDFGVDPLKIEQLVVEVEAAVSGQPPIGLILRFSKPQQREELMNTYLRGGDAVEFNGKSYRRTMRPNMPCVSFADDRTWLVAAEPLMRSMLSSDKVESPLTKSLAVADVSADATAIVSVDALRPLINFALAQLPPIPPQFEPFEKAPDHLSSVELRLNIGADLTGSLVLRGKNAEAGKQIEELVRLALDLSRQAIEDNLAGEQVMDEMMIATKKYVRRIADALIGAVVPRREAERVSIAFRADLSAATVGLAAGLILPAVQSARETGRRNVSVNNMRQIALALHGYNAAHDRFPARASFSPDGKPLLSWRVHILPYLEENELYRQFHLDEPWDSEHNRALIDKMPAVYRNPGSDQLSSTPYLLPVGAGTLFEGKDAPTLDSVKDGTSNTVFVVEADEDRAVVWTKPDDLIYNPQTPLAGLGHQRAGAFLASFVDGSVHFIPNNIDPTSLKSLFTARGGEAVQIPND